VRPILGAMRALLLGLAGFSVLGSFACSDESEDGGVAGGVSVAGSAGAAAAGAAGTGGGSSGSAGTSSAPQGGASSGGSGSELGIGGNVELLPGAGAGGDDQGGGEVEADAGVVPPPVLGTVCPAGPFAANPLAGAAEPEIVCDGMTFTEGAVWFAERNELYFSDFQIGAGVANGRIMRFTPGGTCEEFIADAGTNGLVIGLDGNLLGARHVDQTLTSFDLETGDATVFLADNNGVNFNSPNDITIRSDGNLYFTDPNYFVAGRNEQPMRAYRRAPDGVVSVVDENGTPNGISLSPDETRLYVSRLNQGQPSTIAVFDVDASGATSNPQTFIGDRGSDGMAIDCAGNLYITNQGVQVFSPTGELIGSINAPQAANVAFGGPDRRTLFITAGATLRTVELAIPGLPY
jgi:gluconolactonase